MLDRYGEKSLPTLAFGGEPHPCATSEELWAGQVSVPSLMLLQAPIFHGHAFSLYIELEQSAQMEELTAAISGEHVDVLQGGEESPSNVNAAGQEQIQVFAASRCAATEWLLAVGGLRQSAHCSAERR